MSKVAWSSLYDLTRKVLWALFLVCLPVTSFPFFPPALGGGALVRPLSLFPLIILFVAFTLPYILRKPLPLTLLCSLPFVLVAIASSLLALLHGFQPALGVSIAERMFRAWITLGLGLAIYWTVSVMARDPEELRASLKWLYLGFSAALLWGSVQAVYVVRYTPQYFRLISKLQKFVSIRPLFNNRISGMTYEPNWFAEQISFLLLPWLLGSVLTGQSVFRWRWRWLTIEWLLLGWSVAVLAFTFSRAGLVSLIVLVLVSLLFLRRPHKDSPARQKRPLGTWTRRLIEAGLVVAALVSFIYFAGSNNLFFSRLWSYWSEIKKNSLSGYFDYIGFGARFTYAETAVRTYEAYPLFGVGIGNYAFTFDQMMPDEPVAAMPEVLRLLTPEVDRDQLITTKNLYLRLLSETGLAGMATFLAYLVSILGCILFLWLSPHHEQKFWGKAGLLGLVAFLMAAFTFDSFAIPNMWVVFGLITSAAWIYRNPDDIASTSRDQNVIGEGHGET
jgi:hypothetical protein